jgi:site-specific recombinase XerD
MNRLLKGYSSGCPAPCTKQNCRTAPGYAIYSPHSLCATAAPLLLDSGVAIEALQNLRNHRHITTTHIYDKRRRAVKDSTSHKMPI